MIVIDHMTKLNPEEGIAVKIRKSHLLRGYIVGIPFCDEVIDHVRSNLVTQNMYGKYMETSKSLDYS